ncbi:uncharacterized protein LOC135836375 [Planococcus citri]|uniref:uncharacterized protein LOC135836375 n=1 Tax=Planococcus citri TaxID=170843 RepID=UPI0031F92F31
MTDQIKSIVIKILCIYSCILNISGAQSLSNVKNLGKNEEPITHCENWQFACKNGQCSAKPFICDGLKDCSDGSDETYEQCRNTTSMKCDKNRFQCHYGACIKSEYKCDGLKQCIDGSDESPQMCNLAKNNPKRRRRNTGKSCAVPASSPDKTIAFPCDKNPSQGCAPTTRNAPEYSVATVTCAPGYYGDNADNGPAHVCFNSQWSPKIAKCVKKCDQLNPVNVNFQCFRNGVNIGNCNAKSVLLAGTKLRPSCIPTYKHDNPPSYYEITCDDQGKWDNNLVPCVPECGKPYRGAQLTVYGGNQEPVGGSPWHVAIFNKKKILICGGSIISEKLVLSAAHCFSNGDSCEGTNCVEDFEVAVGKYTNNYAAKDAAYQKIMKIKEIRFPKKGYYGVSTYYASDMAILILRDPITINPAVLPICINWADVKSGKYPSEGELGKVVGWGRTENGTLSTVLRNISLPYISYQRCVDKVNSDFKPFVTFDKFCAGTGNHTGPTLLDGDSGGGLVFEDRGLFYLRGIVSIKQYGSNSVNVFTDLTEHIDWIASVRDEVEKKPKKNQVQVNNVVSFTTVYQTVEAETPIKRAPEEIVQDLQSHEFSSAEEKLQQASDGTYKYIVKKVYDHQIANFELLLSFGESIENPEQKLKIFDALYYEMRTTGHNDTPKLLRLSQSIKKGILDRATGQTATAAQSLFDALCSVTCCRPLDGPVEEIFSAFLNDNSWPSVQQLSSDMSENCYQTLVSIYDKAIERLWGKVNLIDILNRAENNLKHLDERMVIHQKIFVKLLREGTLQSNSAILLARHMKSVQDDSAYKNVNSERRSQYEAVKNRLPSTVLHMVFQNYVCIRNIAYKEYLGIDENYKYKNQDQHLVFTFMGGYAKRGHLDLWKITFTGDTQVTIQSGISAFMKCTDETYDPHGRYVFASPATYSDRNARWNLEFDKAGLFIKNDQYNEYIHSDANNSKDSKRYLAAGIGWGRVDDGSWEITDCTNP